jgi:hypothetical protein
MQDADPDVHRSLVWLLENSVDQVGDDMYFTVDYDNMGEVKSHELLPNGAEIQVRERERENMSRGKYVRTKWYLQRESSIC